MRKGKEVITIKVLKELKTYIKGVPVVSPSQGEHRLGLS